MKIKTAILALGLVSINALLGCGQKEYLMPPAKGPDTPDNAFMQEMATKSGGDFNKLTPEEQAKANKIAAGHGADALKYMVKPK